MKAADLAVDHPDLLNVKIVGWNPRAKKNTKRPIQIIDPTQFRFEPGERANDAEKYKHKYILCPDGHVSAFRLGSELKSGSVIFKPKSDYKIWFSHMLVPGIHYIEVDSMLKDLVEKVKWCRENDDQCKQIAINAQKFYDTYLNKTAILRYFAQQLYNIRRHRSNNFLDYSLFEEKSLDLAKSSSSSSNKSRKSGKSGKSSSTKSTKSSSSSSSIPTCIAIITIFRDNKDFKYHNQRLNFIRIMSKLFESVPHKIIIVEQAEDNYGFNIGN